MNHLRQFYEHLGEFYRGTLQCYPPLDPGFVKTTTIDVPVVQFQGAQPTHSSYVLPAEEVLPPIYGERVDVDVHRSTFGSSSRGHSATSFFKNANKFTVNNSIMGENIQIMQGQVPNFLGVMLEYAIPGARYDSSARDSPPKCHPGTRIQILERVQTRIHDPDVATSMVWIYGPAGVGKSAIMQTLAEAEKSRGATFATLFFSRPNERDDPRKVFATLAYDLAVHNSKYRRYIEERLADDATFLAKSMDEQFQHLFITPFLTPFTKNNINIGPQRWFVFLDGLDECRGEMGQRRIIELIRNSTLHCAMSAPFIWIIASRPETHLRTQFLKVKEGVAGFWELEVPINSEESLRDVERYLHREFSDMHENYPDSIPPLWPSESDFLKVSEASSGLFLFASTLVGYLLGGDPVSRLRHVTCLIKATRTQTIDPEQNPFQNLDILYTQIMSDVPKEVLSTTKLLLGFYLLQTSRRSIPLLRASNILGLEQYEVYAALRKLRSVLNCPPHQEAAHRPVEFLHASFSEFLLDPSRSDTFSIGSNEITKIWHCCAEVLHQFTAHNRIDLPWPPQGRNANLVALRKSVGQEAQENWMRVLLKSSEPTWRGGLLLIDDASLVKTLRGLGPTIFLEVRVGEPAIEEFLHWLDSCAPSEVRSSFLHKTFPVRDLDVDKLFMSLCEQRWCYRIFMSYDDGSRRFLSQNIHPLSAEQFDASKWRQAKEVLWNEHSVFWELLLDRNQQVLSHVLGFEQTRQCIVIGPFLQSPHRMTYYILPYFDENVRWDRSTCSTSLTRA